MTERLSNDRACKTVPWSKGRTPAFHAGDIGFKSHGDHYGWVCLAARAADCKSVTRKHRRFDSCPIHLCLRVREADGAALLRRCAKFCTEGSNPSVNVSDFKWKKAENKRIGYLLVGQGRWC